MCPRAACRMNGQTLFCLVEDSYCEAKAIRGLRSIGLSVMWRAGGRDLLFPYQGPHTYRYQSEPL